MLGRVRSAVRIKDSVGFVFQIQVSSLNADVESHMILAVLGESYLALAKGGLVDDHLLLIPVSHHSSSRSIELLSDSGALYRSIDADIAVVMKEVEGLQMESGSYVVLFEVFQGGDPNAPLARLAHMHTNLVPLKAALIEGVQKAFEDMALEQGLEIQSELPKSPFWPYCRVKVRDGPWLIYTPPQGGKVMFDITIGRRVMAKIMGKEELINWKDCVKSQNDETDLANKLRKLYAL